MLTRTGEACTNRKQKPVLGNCTRTRVSVNLALN